jgi:hypothetical protein
MQTNEKPSQEVKQYFIVSDELLNWMRGMAYTKCTLQEVEGMTEELFNAPTLQQYLELKKDKPKIITN